MKSAPQYGSGKSRSTAVRHYALLCIRKSSRLARELLRGMWQTSHTAWAMWIGLTESHSAGGTEQAGRMLSVQVIRGRGGMIGLPLPIIVDARAPQTGRCEGATAEKAVPFPSDRLSILLH